MGKREVAAGRRPSSGLELTHTNVSFPKEFSYFLNGYSVRDRN